MTAAKLITGLKGLSCEERLGVLGLSSLGNRKLIDYFTALFNFLRRGRGAVEKAPHVPLYISKSVP